MKFIQKAVICGISSAIAVASIKKDSKHAGEWRAAGEQPPVRYVPGVGIYTPVFYAKEKGGSESATVSSPVIRA